MTAEQPNPALHPEIKRVRCLKLVPGEQSVRCQVCAGGPGQPMVIVSALMGAPAGPPEVYLSQRVPIAICPLCVAHAWDLATADPPATRRGRR